MTTPTAARPQQHRSAHWYTTDGKAVHEVPKADGKGKRRTTVTDARKDNYLPSVTGIIDQLHKEALVNWKIEQASLAVLTAPRLENECESECPMCHERKLKLIDEFVFRVLHTEQQQNEEARIAADRGTLLHDALADYFHGQAVADELLPWLEPAFKHLYAQGELVTTEAVLVGLGYAGTTDLILDGPECWWLKDYKCTKKLPDKSPWPEHRLQLAAYAKAFKLRLERAGEYHKLIKVANVYISTAEKGKFVEWVHEDDWEQTYEYGFAPLVVHWQWANRHWPSQPEFVSEQLEEPPVDTLPQGASNVPAEETAGAGNPATSQNTPRPSLHKSGKTVVWTPGVAQ